METTIGSRLCPSPTCETFLACRLAGADEHAHRDPVVALGRQPGSQEGQQLVAEQRVERAFGDPERGEGLDRDLAETGPPDALVEGDLRQRARQATGPGRGMGL